MIEREAMVKISSDLLANLLGGTKAASGRLFRFMPRRPPGSTLTCQRVSYTTLLPVAGTAIIATKPEPEVAPIEVER